MKNLREWVEKWGNVVFFIGGFVFDAVTLRRIDSTLDLLWQSIYLLAIVFVIDRRTREDAALWQPSGFLQKIWHYETEAVHFCYGGLLSGYTIFYFKSTTMSRSAIFLGLIIVLMFLNEMPQLRRAGDAMRLGLFTFCVVSYLNYLFPVLIGRMGGWIFALAWILSAAVAVALVRHLANLAIDPPAFRRRFGWSPAAVLIIVAGLYIMKWIPPVPLSLQYAGVYHAVERDGNRYRLEYRKPPWYFFWRKDDRLFLARPGDQVTCLLRVFAPRRFEHQIWIRWKHQSPAGAWVSTDRMALAITGGRGEGFRGVARKENYEPGPWKIEVETEDGRVLGGVSFRVQPDTDPAPPDYLTRWM